MRRHQISALSNSPGEREKNIRPSCLGEQKHALIAGSTAELRKGRIQGQNALNAAYDPPAVRYPLFPGEHRESREGRKKREGIAPKKILP